MNVTQDWLKRLHGRSPGYFSVVVFKNGRPVVVKAYNAESIDEAAAAIDATKQGDIYVSCATYAEPPNEHKRGTSKGTVSIPGFWAEIDIDGPGHKPDANKLPLPKNIDQALSILDGGPEPTALIHSGGGLHAWWLFDEPWTYTDTEAAQAASDDWQRLISKRAEEKGFSVDKVSDLARILRPPGTANRKLKDAREVKLYKESGKSYPIIELTSIGLPPEPRTHAEAEDDSGFSWAEILEPHGWTQIRERDDRAVEWYRPGKTEGTISAVTDPYGVPVLVNFSSNTELPVGAGQKLTKFKVWAHLNYHGDFVAAKSALDAKKVKDDSALIERAEKYSTSLIVWPDFWTEVEPEIDWLAEPIIEQGRQIAIYSEAKQGKSLLMLEICALLAAGESVLGNAPRDPIDILYIDKENMRVDLRERLHDMGLEGANLEHLHYAWFPDMPWFDKPQGGLDLLGLALKVNAKMVVIDTLSRVVEGLEQVNDTYHDFYKHTGVWFKQRGITLIRLDHSGKDSAKGMRGASSKTTDVDDVWELRSESLTGPVHLNRTHSRANHGASRISLERFSNPLRHMPVDIIRASSIDIVDQCIQDMDLAEIPTDVGLVKAWSLYREKRTSSKYTQKIVNCAQKRRQGMVCDEVYG